MTVKRYVQTNIGSAALAAHPIHYVCDTTGELPNSGLKLGDTAHTLDSNTRYKATSATTWTADDSHAALSGVTADQHHAQVHGSAQHTGGMFALQEEGVGAGSIATLNVVGAGASAAVVGTVGTITVPGTSGSALAVKSADQARTSSTATVDVTDMVVPLLANEVWRGTANIIYTSLSAGLVLSWTVPAGCAIAWGPDSSYDTNNPAGLLTASDTFLLSTSASGSVSIEAEIRYRITNGGNVGNAQLRMAASLSSANACTMRRDSSLASVRLR